MLEKKILCPFLNIFLFWFVFLQKSNTDLLLQTTFFINMILSVHFIFKDQRQPYSLYKIFYLFVLFFYGVAPFIQYSENVLIWTNEMITPEDYLNTNIFVFVIIILFEFIYNRLIVFYKLKSKCFKNNKSIVKWSYLTIAIMFTLSISIFFLTYHICGYNLYSLFFRGGELTEGRIDLTQTESLLFDNFIRPMPLIIFMFYYFSKVKIKLVSFLFLMIGVATLAPTSVARLQAAALYIPICLLLFQILSKKNVFVFSFILSLLVLFPSLNQFRNITSLSQLEFVFNFDMFKEGHFDAYQNFLIVVKHDIVTYGYQLLGPIFFYLPRTFWPDKPIGSGHFLAKELGFSFSNISMPFPAEGYINFGFVGMLIFILVLAYVVAKLDKQYWIILDKDISPRLKIRYLILLGMLFFILRGDLLSGVAYTVGLLLCILFISYSIKYVNKLSLKKSDLTA